MGAIIRVVVKVGSKVAKADLTDPTHPVHQVVQWLIGG